jgi:hypothetical protein
MESFFSSVKSADRFESCGAAKLELFDYVEVFYNTGAGTPPWARSALPRARRGTAPARQRITAGRYDDSRGLAGDPHTIRRGLLRAIRLGCLVAHVGGPGRMARPSCFHHDAVVGGFLIFPATELLIRAIGERAPVSSPNAPRFLGMQIACVLQLSMPLLLPVGLYRLNWFYPAMMILLGAHYLPFVFLYGMRMSAFLVGGGTLLAMYFSASFSIGAWYTGTILLILQNSAEGW